MLKLVSNKKILSSVVLGASLLFSGLNAKGFDCENRSFNIKVKEEITKLDILNQLSDICNFTVVPKDELAKNKLTIKQQGINIKNLTLDDVFALLLGEDGLDYSFDNNILKINGYLVKTFKLDYINSIREASALLQASVEASASDSGSGDSDSKGGGSGINSVKSQEKFDFWKDINTEIKNVLMSIDQSNTTMDPIINPNTGMITVRGTKEQIDKVSEYIELMKERVKKQVIIDVSIIEVIHGVESNRGINWSKFNMMFNSKVELGKEGPTEGADAPAEAAPAEFNPLATLNGYSGAFLGLEDGKNRKGSRIALNAGLDLEGVLSFLDNYGKTRVVSNPKVVAMNNQPAIISVGKTVNYLLKDSKNNDGGGSSEGTENKSLFIGILLNILPEISDDNKVMLRINPALSDFLYTQDDKKSDTPREVAPDTQQKKLSTVVRVNDGQTIVLGGLIDNKIVKERTEVPLLSKIPLLGYLFKYEGKKDVNREIVFVITPRVVELGDYDHKKSLQELGYSNDVFGLEDDNVRFTKFITIKGLEELKSKEISLDNMGYEE